MLSFRNIVRTYQYLKRFNDGIRVESFRPDVFIHVFYWIQRLTDHSYNRYLAVAARVVRRSLKEGERLKAERRGEMELRFANWEVGLVKTNEKITGIEN